ncbi:hypothetical protein BRADI_5g03171v3 [Brachypodium distachyon]|uniref:Uncharacterized protein n=1 Tax=Brachypodium distachyon TaxID=15368 RepID=A0A2K2CF64_BRADI|nr:hypothetical protein BRADI_5g03171v3 [Brachypodium distachyon]
MDSHGPYAIFKVMHMRLLFNKIEFPHAFIITIIKFTISYFHPKYVLLTYKYGCGNAHNHGLVSYKRRDA